MNGPDIFLLDLNKATEQPGCPICNIGVKVEERYMRHFLHESVNDVKARKNLHKSWGYCNRHAWQLQELEVDEYKDGLKNAILYEWMLGRAIKESKLAIDKLNQEVKKKPFWVKQEPVSISEAFERHQVCPVCQSSMRSQSFHLEILIKNLTEAGCLERYKSSDGLCMQHFVEALELPLDKKLLVKLCELQTERLSQIFQNLRSYINKHDYQNQEPYTSDEQKAAIKAIAFMVGKRKIES